MKTGTVILIISILLIAGFSVVQPEEIDRLKKENASLKAMIGPPPSSLDSLYPPIVQAPLYQIKMLEMAAPFSSFVIKIFEGDRNAARILFDSFREQYAELSEVVPQWKNDFPTEPLDELAALIAQGATAEIFASVEKVGSICHNCHIFQMPKVQQKYHWPDFSMISLTDPLSNTDVEFRRFMMSLELSVNGMGLELQQGQVEKALGYFEMFKTGLEQLEESCIACHETERKYYVGQKNDELVNQLETELRSNSPDMMLIGQLGQQIGTETCIKCHLVHIPAAYAKARWSEMDKFAN